MLPENVPLFALLILGMVCLLAAVIVLLEPHRHPGRGWRSNTTKID